MLESCETKFRPHGLLDLPITDGHPAVKTCHSSGERLEGFVVVVVVFLLYSVYMFNPGIDTMKLLF